jgi:hypothetical protein
MGGRKKYLKGLALVPAIVLAGGFVGYRAGAFPADFFRLSAKPEPAPAPQPEPVAAQSPPAAPPLASIETGRTVDPTFMAGSKSMILVPTPQAVPPAPTAGSTLTPPPAANPAIIYGSKSAPIFPAQSPPTPAQPSTPAPKSPMP